MERDTSDNITNRKRNVGNGKSFSVVRKWKQAVPQRLRDYEREMIGVCSLFVKKLIFIDRKYLYRHSLKRKRDNFFFFDTSC